MLVQHLEVQHIGPPGAVIVGAGSSVPLGSSNNGAFTDVAVDVPNRGSIIVVHIALILVVEVGRRENRLGLILTIKVARS
jgi:hypothetical protein